MREKLIRYTGYLLQVKWLFLAAILSGMVAATASGFGIPVMTVKVFPIIFGEKPAPEWVDALAAALVAPESRHQFILIASCLMLPLVFLVRGVAMLVNGYLINYVGMRVLENIRMDVFKKLQSLPLAFHEKQQRGDLISRMLADTQNVQMGITQVANDLIKQPMTTISCLAGVVYMLWDKGQMGMLLVNCIFVALAIWPIYYFGQKVTQKARKAQQELGFMTSVAQEALASQREIRSYALEDYEIGLFGNLTNRFVKVQLKTVKYRQFLMPTMEFVSAIGLAYILVMGRQQGMNFTDFIALAGAIFFAFDSLKRVGIAYNRFKQAQASLERLEAVLSEPDSMPDPVNPIEPSVVEGDVRFDHVSFAYDEKNEVLSDVNVHIPAGQVVGLVGPSGAGKTTFASLILRFYEATKGAVLIDGIDVRKMKKTTLRRFIALVSQHAILFRNTILENIRLGRDGATDEETLAAAKDASVLEFASMQPEGINTMLGDAGGGLSGGQRQRVAIARAFLKDAPILILDEATASLDAESENKIQQELQRLSQGRTTFIVAHRFSTIRHVDRILVFQSGRIVGDGTHEELYASVPIYRELYDRQGL